MNLINYFKYSGLTITITVNPYHWAWIPVFVFDESVDMWYNNTVRISILFLTVRFWIDNGDW
jgi:hypothetical protein